MPNRKLIGNIQIDDYDLNVSNWPEVFVENLSPEEQDLYYRRKDAVIMYLKNEKTVKEISKITNISSKSIWRIIKRCFESDNKGFIWAYRALIPNKRICKYERSEFLDKSSNGEEIVKTGCFSILLDENPEIREKIVSYYLNLNKDKITDPVIRLKFLHKKFIDLCRMAGIKDTDYPFNTENLGRISLYRFINKIKNDYFTLEAKRNGEDAARIARSTGIGERNSPIIIRPLERVQFDGHKIDAIISITFNTPEGDEFTVILDRIWLLVIVDEATRVVLGHHLCLNREYSSSDVLKCIRNAVLPKKLKELTIPGLKYPENAGFHSLAIPEVKWARWDEFSYDNGRANLSNVVRNRLIRILKCAVNPGPVNMPERRGIIERFFGILEENGYHRLPNTTGSSPKDSRRNKPEEKAIKYSISSDELEELTEVLIANYNNTPNEGINNFSPLQCMRHRVIDRKLLPRTIEYENRNEIVFLTLHEQRVVKGDSKKGKRPYINFEGVEYRSEVLSNSPGLIGAKLDLFINIDDIRVIRAFLPDGSEFGSLTATGKWGVAPHSLQLRKQINKLKNRKQIFFTFMDDPIMIYEKYLKEKSKTNKRERNRLASLDKYKKDKYDGKEPSISLVVDNLKEEIRKSNNDSVTNHSKFERKVIKTIVY